MAHQDPTQKGSEKRQFDEVFKTELGHIGRKEEDNLMGLSLSGGGIRSASFCIGVLQELQKEDVLGSVDYLSTVSGGGYTGACLTWFRQMGIPGVDTDGAQGRVAGTDPSAEELGTTASPNADHDCPDTFAFPFGQAGVGSRGDRRHANAILDFIRQHAHYLDPGFGLNLMSFVAVVIRGMIVSLAVYVGLASVAMVGLLRLGLFGSPTPSTPRIWWLTTLPIDLNYLLWLAVALLCLVGVAAVWYSLRTGLPRGFFNGYFWSIFDQRFIGVVWTLLLGVAAVGSLPIINGQLGSFAGGVAGGTTGLGGILGYFQFRQEQSGTPKGKLSRIRIVLGAVALTYGILLLAFIVGSEMRAQSMWWTVGVFAGSLLVGFLVNVNMAGLHRMYRDRLMETFMSDSARVLANQWGRADRANKGDLADMCQRRCRRRPYHLVNTNVILVDSSEAKYRGRGGDSFVLSPLWCGSYATGWCRTRDFKQSRGRGLTLATAMAVSGAAVNPNAGVAGKGVTRDRFVSFLMSALNLRLGYWAPNPRLKSGFVMPPNYIRPGIWGGLLGSGLDETARTLELTDGGHFENLGIYELVRRRVRLIIASDAGADPDFKFGDLTNALERVRVDFGVSIRFRKETGIDGVMPGSADQGGALPKEVLAKRGYAVAEIEYDRSDPNKSGTLIYIKSTLTPDLPADLYGYRKGNESYPDQSTADQFFDEAQFEAYRELGYQLTKTMINDGELAWATAKPHEAGRYRDPRPPRTDGYVDVAQP